MSEITLDSALTDSNAEINWRVSKARKMAENGLQ